MQIEQIIDETMEKERIKHCNHVCNYCEYCTNYDNYILKKNMEYCETNAKEKKTNEKRKMGWSIKAIQ